MATVTPITTKAAMAGKATRQFNKVPRKYAARISPIESGFAARNLPANFRWKTFGRLNIRIWLRCHQLFSHVGNFRQIAATTFAGFQMRLKLLRLPRIQRIRCEPGNEFPVLGTRFHNIPPFVLKSDRWALKAFIFRSLSKA